MESWDTSPQWVWISYVENLYWRENCRAPYPLHPDPWSFAELLSLKSKLSVAPCAEVEDEFINLFSFWLSWTIIDSLTASPSSWSEHWLSTIDEPSGSLPALRQILQTRTSRNVKDGGTKYWNTSYIWSIRSIQFQSKIRTEELLTEKIHQHFGTNYRLQSRRTRDKRRASMKNDALGLWAFSDKNGH